MRNRLDERSWRLMLFRMLHYSGSPLIVRGRQRGSLEQEEMIIKWLARVRGPDSRWDRSRCSRARTGRPPMWW